MEYIVGILFTLIILAGHLMIWASWFIIATWPIWALCVAFYWIKHAD